MNMVFRYGLSASLWCACADYVERGADATQLLRAAVNAPRRTEIVAAAEACVSPYPGTSSNERHRSGEVLACVARLTLLRVCPQELGDLHQEIGNRWSRTAAQVGPGVISRAIGSEEASRPADHLMDENRWQPYNDAAVAWFSDNEREIEKAFYEWSKAHGVPDKNSSFEPLIASLCAIKGRP
jgi:hypothetical protein